MTLHKLYLDTSLNLIRNSFSKPHSNIISFLNIHAHTHTHAQTYTNTQTVFIVPHTNIFCLHSYTHIHARIHTFTRCRKRQNSHTNFLVKQYMYTRLPHQRIIVCSKEQIKARSSSFSLQSCAYTDGVGANHSTTTNVLH